MPYVTFNRYLSEHGHAIHNISVIADKLPKDPDVLRELAARCRATELSAARAGKEYEVRRFSNLARQFEALLIQKST